MINMGTACSGLSGKPFWIVVSWMCLFAVLSRGPSVLQWNSTCWTYRLQLTRSSAAMRVRCWTPNPFKGEFDNKHNTYRHGAWHLFVSSWIYQVLGEKFEYKCLAWRLLMWIFLFHRNSPTQKTPGPEDHEDVQSESEAETETLPEVTEESLPSEKSEVSNQKVKLLDFFLFYTTLLRKPEEIAEDQ